MLQQLCIHCRFCHCNTTHEVLRNDVCVYPCASLRMLLLLIISICTDTIRIFSTHSFCYSNSCVPMQRNPRYRHPAQPFAYCSLACIRCLIKECIKATGLLLVPVAFMHSFAFLIACFFISVFFPHPPCQNRCATLFP